jgi:hypothetical protein
MKKKVDQTLTSLADAAFQQAAQKVIERAEESGTPVIVWEHEAVTKVKPEVFSFRFSVFGRLKTEN